MILGTKYTLFRFTQSSFFVLDFSGFPARTLLKLFTCIPLFEFCFLIFSFGCYVVLVCMIISIKGTFLVGILSNKQ